MAKTQDPSAAEKKKLQDEKKRLKADQKNQKKEARKRAKELAAQEAELAEDEEGGGFFTFLATLAIIAVWIAIICVVIKLDVGGFGSNVLTPLLKDIPVVNMILPTPAEEDATGDGETGGYTSISDAVAQIRSLEQQLQQAQAEGLLKDEQIASLTQEVARLQQFENAQTEFNRIQLEFFDEVVYSEKGPGAEEYRKYFEEMNPSIAESLYKQVVQQLEEDSEFQDYASSYATMKPAQAAALFEEMTDNLNLVARILNAMTAEERGDILGAMDAEIAARLTKIMDPQS